MANPFGAAGGAYVRKWPSLAEYGHFWGLWGPPVPLFGDLYGPNGPVWMCLIISNLVQPMSNPFRAIGGAYGQKWAFWAKNGRFRVSGDPRCHFLGALKAQTGHPGCV